jgi:Tat protein secretion system quality control protein TatD with DNase activity
MSADHVPSDCEQFEALSLLARALKKSGRNEPCAMPLIAQTLAELYGMDVKSFSERVLETTRRLVGLSSL